MKKTYSGIEEVIQKINKRYGDGTLVRASEAVALKLSRIPLESFSLTVETGGGLPENRIILIVGGYSTAKSFVAYKAVKGALEKYPDKIALWIDAEGAHDEVWAEKVLGSRELLNRLYVTRPQFAQQALNIVDDVVRSGDCVMVVIDSLEALVPLEEVESDFEEGDRIGRKARLMNQFFRKISNATSFDNLRQENPLKTTIVVINQTRQKIQTYGDPTVLPGGKGQEFAASLILELSRGEVKTEKVGDIENVVGMEIHFKTRKNKTFAPNRTGSFDIYIQDCQTLPFRAGQIDRLREVVRYGALYGIINRKGPYYYLQGDDKGFQGASALTAYLMEQPEVVKRIEAQVLDLATRKAYGSA